MTENKDALPLDWLKIAKLAGEHGVRYQTNARLEAFLADLSIKPPIQDAMRETVIGVIRDKLSSFDYPVSAYEREFADAIMAALSAPNVAGEVGKNADLASLIETRLLGVPDDDQDIVLEDHDWRRIIAALSTRNGGSYDDPTAEGDRVAGLMREHFEHHKHDAWDGYSSDNLMIGLLNIARGPSAQPLSTPQPESVETTYSVSGINPEGGPPWHWYVIGPDGEVAYCQMAEGEQHANMITSALNDRVAALRPTKDDELFAEQCAENAKTSAALAEAIEALRLIMSCTVQIHNGKIVFDCGDPYEIAAQVVAKHGGSDVLL